MAQVPQNFDSFSKDEKVLFWLGKINEGTDTVSRDSGILGNSKTCEEALGIFDTTKKLCQRLEWWPEMDAEIIRTYVRQHRVSNSEILAIIESYTYHRKYVYERIFGNQEPVDFFQCSHEEKDYKEIEWYRHFENGGGKKEGICFITCSNNDRELEEMNAWIDRLRVPEGLEVEKVAIKGAGSMCSGYNKAMRDSDAKYKVYLHQDVRILNPYFIYDIIACFDRNPRAGMIGMFGADSVPEDGVMWHTKRYGAMIHSELGRDTIAETFDERAPYDGDFSAALVDGVLIVTCVDIKWREDVFTSWDFYDASQSMEFKNRGYEIIVPFQDKTWCLHDFGQINWVGYIEARDCFLDTYLIDTTGGTASDEDSYDGEKCMSIVKDKLQNLLNMGENEASYKLIEENIGKELTLLKQDPSYCLLAASAYLNQEQMQRAFDIMTIGLLQDIGNYELYLLLGEYYGRTNLKQALLCFYQALFYCNDENDSEIIQSYIENVVGQGASVRQVSVVISSKNQSEHLKKCLESIVNTVFPGLYEIIVVDDSSEDDTANWLAGIDGITYCINEEELGYTKSANIGIKLSSAFNDVLLLDADTILVDNSLFYLMLGLYSDDNIGAIGGITNDYVIDQKMYIDTSDFEAAKQISVNVNCPMNNAYEKAVYISDHAMLIRREALDRVGLLDERFSPDQYEDKDFCVRVNDAGMDVILCFNSYIFKFMDRHGLYGDKTSVEEKNKKKFAEKWGCNIDYSNNARGSLIELIEADEEKAIEVLELGCAMGSTLSRIKRMWPSAHVQGVEYDASAARIGASINDIIQGDVENMQIPYEPGQFDYIICADVLEHLRDPENALRRFLPYLKDNGRFIISLPNIRHHAVVELLALSGRFDYGDSGILDRTHLKFFTKDTAIDMIENAGLLVERVERNYNGHPEDNEFINKLTRAFNVYDPDDLKVFQYYFVAKVAQP